MREQLQKEKEEADVKKQAEEAAAEEPAAGENPVPATSEKPPE
jgi:hypothetical protein